MSHTLLVILYGVLMLILARRLPPGPEKAPKTSAAAAIG